MEANSFDHVALWVEDRHELAEFLLRVTRMHEISQGDDFTLLGADAKQGKLTLFDAEGPREPGVLRRIAVRVRDLGAAMAALPAGVEPQRDGDGQVTVSAPGGVELAFVEYGDEALDYDLDHVVLRVPDPDATAAGLAELGFAREGHTLRVADRRVVLEPGPAPNGARPLLNHLALLVDSAERMRGEAQQRGLEIDKVVDAENTFAVFVRGPDEITVEYVEHKPGFALV